MYRQDYGDVTFAYVRGKDCVEKFMEHIEDEVKRLYAAFPQQPKTELNDGLKKNTKRQKSVMFASKGLIIPMTER